MTQRRRRPTSRLRKKAWKVAKARPYYLSDELGIENVPNYNFPNLWAWADWKQQARGMYAVRDSNWDFGTVLQQTSGYKGLRTRELLSFLESSMIMYRVTDETGTEKQKYPR